MKVEIDFDYGKAYESIWESVVRLHEIQQQQPWNDDIPPILNLLENILCNCATYTHSD